MTHRSIEAGLAILFAVATGSFVFAGCNGSNSDNPNSESPGTVPSAGATPTATPSTSPTIAVGDWSQVTDLTNCEAMLPDRCLGAYGFTVMSDGTWAAGPSPSGKTYSGRLTDDQIATIQADINLLTQDDLTANLVCTQAHGIEGKQETMQIWYDNQPYTMYKYLTSSGAECYSGNDKTDARLLVDLRGLMQQYYPIPFGDVSPTPSPSVTPTMTPLPEPTVTALPSSPTSP